MMDYEGCYRSNLGWRNHLNFMWNQQEQGVYAQNLPQVAQYAHPACSDPNMSDIMKCLAQSNEIVKNMVQSQQAFQKETQAALGSMCTHITQLTTQIYQIQADQCKLPSQMELDPKENVCVVTPESGRMLVELEPNKKIEEAKHEEDERNEGKEFQNSKEINSPKVSVEPKVSNSQTLIVPPFASRLARDKKDEDKKDILEDLKENYVENFRDDELEHILASALSEENPKTEENEAIREIIQVLYSGEDIPVRNLSSSMPIPTSTEQILPSIEKPPNLEQKVLPQQLKYVFLEEQDTFPVIISEDLHKEQEPKLQPPPHSSCRLSPLTAPYPCPRVLRPPLSLLYPLMAIILWVVCTPFKK